MGTRAWTLASLLLVASYWVGWTSAYSRGAPDSACNSLTPGHGGSPQTNGSPFSLTPSSVSVEPGQRMLVTLESTTGTDRFMGFIVQARDAETDSVLGTFFTTDHKYLTCGPGFNNAVTHGGGAQKAKVVLEWEPKSDFQGDIVFKGSFVKDYSTYWVGVTSEKVTVVSPTTTISVVSPTTPISTTTSTTTTTTTTTTTAAPSAAPAAPTAPTDPTSIDNSIASAMENIYFGCESNKGCFGFPDKCVSTQSCKFLMTYTKAPADNGYRFEISGDINDDKGYIAGGLSSDDKMGDDSVMICRTEGGLTDVIMGWNKGRNNNLLEDFNLGITKEETAFVDGRVYCSFVRDIETQILGNTFNLDNDQYNLMVASGGVGTESRIGYHTVGRTVSGGQINLGEFTSVEAKSNLFAILHGTFMIGAWIFAASIGILMARYFKQTWMRSDCCKVAQWFHWHRFFMGLTWLLTMAGFGFMVYHLEGISTLDPKENPHVVLGFISTGLCFIQPFMALCRCSPQNRRRPIFNWLHWFVGNSAQIVGIAAIFFGLQLWGAPTWTMWLLIIFVAFHCIVHLILSIGQCVSDSKAEHSSNVFPMKDMNGSRNPLHPVDKKDDAPGSTFRKAMLTFYIIVNICITAALILVVYPKVDQLKAWGLIFWE